MTSNTSTGQFQPLETISTPQIHHLTVLSHFTHLFDLYQPVSSCSRAEKTRMNSYNCSPLRPKMDGWSLTASRIYVNGLPWRAASDIPPSPLRTTVPCRRCKPVLPWFQPLTCSIPNLLSQWIIISSPYHSIMRPIRSTPVNSSRPSRPSSEDEHYCGPKCADSVLPSIKFVSSIP